MMIWLQWSHVEKARAEKQSFLSDMFPNDYSKSGRNQDPEAEKTCTKADFLVHILVSLAWQLLFKSNAALTSFASVCGQK